MPNKKGSRPEQAMGDSPQQVTSNTKKILNRVRAPTRIAKREAQI
jgi:hypothetical protein